jgi:hypothetical protein
MKLMFVVLFGALLVGCTAPGPASAPDSALSAAAPVQADAQRAASTRPRSTDGEYWDEIICKRTPLTGTRLSRGQCHTRYDWARIEGAARETMREIENRPLPCYDGPGCTKSVSKSND